MRQVPLLAIVYSYLHSSNSASSTHLLFLVKRLASKSLPHLNWKFSIKSENNFPTAAGLASSAAGYACLVSALAKLYEIEDNVSFIARMGSGSACRSMYGGWVLWCKGSSPDGRDSIAKQIAPASHWPEMRVLILVVNDERKKYSSTDAMKRSVETSELLKYRANQIVPKMTKACIEAIQKKDFEIFAEITMKESNSIHAICQDTYPPCVYLNDTSHTVANAVHAYNEFKSSNKVAYTYDAGPNAVLYLLDSSVDEFMSVINYLFPPQDTAEYYKGLPLSSNQLSQDLKMALNIPVQEPGCLKYIIHTKIGEGPKILTDPQQHLL
ncbi:unnamed protein product [Acanthoscelides obtectus]|uniref:Diphosphomevalonate decarboxylase n=1 Tax=Acanthoscelides obtectus TaxID=200917 RepID=A0A9P0NZB6_ACAOB|nr:unnamed protein product [Acanthoscelides obtectus]CAK1668204.1 Diphosphomevalonate decarboxylase [Acanthoscelides obtectus]